MDANAVEIQTPVPGWRMELYAARSRPLADEWPSDVWRRVGGGVVERRKQRFPLDTGGRSYRYYLVWITQLPPDEGRVEITQVTLLAPEDALTSCCDSCSTSTATRRDSYFVRCSSSACLARSTWPRRARS